MHPAIKKVRDSQTGAFTGNEFGNFLIAIFNEWVKNDVGKVFVQIFETCFGVYLGLPAAVCVFSETCGACLALEHTGDLYSCDHYVQPDALLGNIKEISLNELVFSQAQTVFGKNKKSLLPKKCLRCDVRFICNGDCPKNRIVPSAKGDHPISHLCDGYYKFFRHIDKPMKTMVSLYKSGQPISEISRVNIIDFYFQVFLLIFKKRIIPSVVKYQFIFSKSHEYFLIFLKITNFVYFFRMAHFLKPIDNENLSE